MELLIGHPDLVGVESDSRIRTGRAESLTPSCGQRAVPCGGGGRILGFGESLDFGPVSVEGHTVGGGGRCPSDLLLELNPSPACLFCPFPGITLQKGRYFSPALPARNGQCE